MTNPLIGIDNLVREMTDKEYAELIAGGWTLENTEEIAALPEPTVLSE